MPSPKLSNGAHAATGTPTAPGAASRSASPVLPVFRSARSNRHREIGQKLRLQQHTEALAKANARARALGSLAVTLLAVLACLMAAHALQVEQQQQTQWEQIR